MTSGSLLLLCHDLIYIPFVTKSLFGTDQRSLLLPLHCNIQQRLSVNLKHINRSFPPLLNPNPHWKDLWATRCSTAVVII